MTTTLLDICDEVLADSADLEAFAQPAHDGPTRRITFAEWFAAADAVAVWLQSEGVRTGDVVAIRIPSSIDYAIAYQGIIRAGAVATGINPRLGRVETDHIVARTSPRLVITSLPALPPGDPAARRARPTATDPVAIVWTGGTTGLPKGAWFDHRCLEAMVEGAAPLSARGDRRLSPLPFAHVGYMTRMWDELVHRIATVIVPSPWTPDGAIRALHDERVTVCQGVPTQYRMMFDHPSFPTLDTSHLRLAGIGAARIPPELVVEMRERLQCPVVVRYASTESSVATGTRLDDDVETICTTVGQPNGGVELRLDDVGPTGVGTVCLRSRAMMRGYWDDPELTAATIDGDGWLHTGDLGRLDADGNLRLAGRRTEMYVRGGYNVYPIEVENCLGDHPDLVATAVLGADVDDRLGEIGVLFAVARSGVSPDLGEIRSFVTERLAGFKAPDVLVVVDQLPLTSIGKVDKSALRVIADDGAARWTRSATSPPALAEPPAGAPVTDRTRTVGP
jgi:acyl-CoA synthetase (AMP-forming)/AMP-acid ligase II